MISLRKYLDRNDELVHNLLRALRLLLQGIRIHAVEGDKADYERFRSDVEKFERELNSPDGSADILFVIGAALKALQDYNERTAKFLRVQSGELHSMVSMLTQTVAEISSGSQRSISRLQEIEKQVEKASMLEDIRVLRLRLSECLESLREERVRQAEESTRAVSQLTSEIQKTKSRVHRVTGEGEVLDPVTGLPSQRDAVQAISEAIQSGFRGFLGVFVVERVQSINARFGYATGDQILFMFQQRVAEMISSDDKLFRWRGPTFVALLGRTQSIEEVRTEISRTLSGRIEKTVEIGSRSVLLPVSASWTVLPLLDSAGLTTAKIDNFVAGQVSLDLP